MADDWNVGDLALCVEEADWHDITGPTSTGPRRGEVHEVERLEHTHFPVTDVDGKVYDGVMLGFAKWPKASYWHGSFRKINPLTEAEEREARFEAWQDNRVPETVGG